MDTLGCVNDFRSPECARLAFHMIMEGQKEGRTYHQILEEPGFIDLFKQEFLKDKSTPQLEIKLKNMVRDLRDRSGPVAPELVRAQLFFRARKRGKSLGRKKLMTEALERHQLLACSHLVADASCQQEKRS
jgi:hypothetical protein